MARRRARLLARALRAGRLLHRRLRCNAALALMAPERVTGVAFVAARRAGIRRRRPSGARQATAQATGRRARRAMSRPRAACIPTARTIPCCWSACAAMQRRLGREVRARQAALVRRDGYADLERIACPSLVVACRQDRLRSFAETERMAQHLPHARFAILEDCGHMAPLERPARIDSAAGKLDRGSAPLTHEVICRRLFGLNRPCSHAMSSGRGTLTMSEAQSLFAVLRQSADADCVAALERLVRDAPDRQLARINVLDFAQREGLDEERTIAGVPAGRADRPARHVVERAVPELRQDVLDANTSLKSVRSERVLLRLLQSQQRAGASMTWSR